MAPCHDRREIRICQRVRLFGSVDNITNYAQDGFQALLVDRHLDGDVRKEVVNDLVRARFPCRVVFGVLVVLRNGTNCHRNVLNDLECEEL